MAQDLSATRFEGVKRTYSKSVSAWAAPSAVAGPEGGSDPGAGARIARQPVWPRACQRKGHGACTAAFLTGGAAARRRQGGASLRCVRRPARHLSPARGVARPAPAPTPAHATPTQPAHTRPHSRTARPSPQDVERLRGSIKIEHTLARMGAERLWKLVNTEDFVPALGALTGNMAVQQVAGGWAAGAGGGSRPGGWGGALAWPAAAAVGGMQGGSVATSAAPVAHPRRAAPAQRPCPAPNAHPAQGCTIASATNLARPPGAPRIRHVDAPPP
jgi:hypothetical protein